MDMTTPQRNNIAAAISQRNRELYKSWAQPNALDDFLAFFASDDHPAWVKGESRLVVNNTAYPTRAEIEKTFRPLLRDRKSTDVNLHKESVAVLSPTEAIHFADYTFTTTDANGTSPSYAVAATAVWTFEGNQWKLLHYNQSWPAAAPVEAAT